MGAAGLVYAVVLACAAGYVAFLYARRELPVAGRRWLALARITVLALLLLILADPTLPADGTGAAPSRAWLLVDGSLSMRVPSSDAPSPWQTAVAEARGAVGEDGVVMVFGGEEVEPLGARAPGEVGPSLTSRLTPALERAAEAGVGSVRIFTDARVEDPVAARAAALRLGLPVEIRRLGGGVVGAGVAAFTLPADVRADESVPAEVVLFGVGDVAGDSVTLEVREEGRLVASRRVSLPAEGRRARSSLELPAPREEGSVRYTARVIHTGDAFADDDERVAYTAVDPGEGALVLVSLRPDWEARFLLPALGRVTGLPVRGYLDVGDAGYLVTGPAGGVGTVPVDTVARVAADAEILVVQGITRAEPPPWLADALGRVGRTVVFPRSAAGAAAVGTDAGLPRPGEWYASDELPPSPLAADLGGAELRGLPPLTGLLPPTRAGQGAVPLTFQLRGTGRPEAGLLLVETPGGGRRVVVLAEGWWRWAFRGGESREAYERLWSGVAGWLLGAETAASAPDVRPVRRVNDRAGAVSWRGPSGAAVELTLLRNDTLARDTAVLVPPTGRFEIPPLPPGTYRYRAEIEGSDEDASRGRFDVETYTDELSHPPAPDPDTASVGRAGPGRDADPGGRPLRTHPLPYLLVLVLLCAEWIGRRRKGLR